MKSYDNSFYFPVVMFRSRMDPDTFLTWGRGRNNKMLYGEDNTGEHGNLWLRTYIAVPL